MIEMNVDKILQVSKAVDRNHQSPLELGLQSPLIMLYVLIASGELLNSIIGVCVYVGIRSVNGLLQATTRCQERVQVFMCFTARQHLGVKMMVCLISFSAVVTIIRRIHIGLSFGSL